MANIIVRQKFCKIENELDLVFLSKLNKHLSFKYVGAEFSPAYKFYRWDGIERLLSKKLEFMTGLLNYVLDFYNKSEKQANIIDERQPFILGAEIDLTVKFKTLGLIPYDYQLEAIDLSLKHDRGIFKHATGSGKSITAAMITAKLGLPTIVWVVGKDLLYQFHELFSKLFDQKIGIVGDGLCDTQPISIVSVWTAGKALGLKKKDMIIDDIQDEKYEATDREKILKLIKEAKVHHYDECHICAAKTIRTIYKYSEPQRIYGFTGTPHRDSGDDLLIEGIFGGILHEVKASSLIKRNILSKPYIKFIYIKSYSHYTDNYSKVYSDNVVNNEYRNNVIVSEAKKLIDKGYQVLILFKQINHGKILKKIFDQKEIDIEFLSGKDNAKKRAEVKNNLLNRKSNICLASSVYDLGIDIKTLSALILAGSGKSSIKTLQRIGRVLRNGKEKPFVAVIDLLDSCKFLKKHALIRKSLYETEPEFDINFPKMINKNDLQTLQKK